MIPGRRTQARKSYQVYPDGTNSVLAQQSVRRVETSIEKKRHDLIILQAEHSEYLYKRENEIQDKIEQEQPLTPEEWHLFVMRKTQQLQDSVDRVAQNTERD